VTPRRRSRGGAEPRASARGFSLVETLVVAGLAVALLGAALPLLHQAADAADATAAARWIAARVSLARVRAAREQRTVALRFLRTTPVGIETVADGNGDGVSAADVAAGVDPVVQAADRVEDHFPRVRIGIAASMPAIDDGRTLGSGDDPVRFGAAGQLSLTPAGTATSGTVYLVSAAGRQYAVRVSGVTARVRVWRYDAGAGRWRPV